MTPERGRKRLRFALVYSVYLSACVVGVHYFVFWRPFVHELAGRNRPETPELPAIRHVEASTVRRVGRVLTGRRDSFVNFPLAKPAATIRVCCFGDSFTYGDEVADGYDYPALLQAQFQRHRLENVEVVNFGSSWHGFHQSYLMWDEVGRRFDCDDVLLGPESFQAERDTTSNHTNLRYPYYLHAHYVVDGDDVRLVEIPGETHEERFAEYFRLPPRWEFLRYDRNLPPAIQAALPAHRTLPNVLHYFRGPMKDEALRTYRVLLRRLGDSARQVVVLQDVPAVLDAARSVGRASMIAVEGYTTWHFPYRAPDDHYSPFGNQLVAAQFFSQLVAGAGDRLEVLESTDPPPPSAPRSASMRRPLTAYDNIEVRLGARTVGYLTTAPLEWSAVAQWSGAILKGGSATSLLTVRDPATPWIDAYYIAVDFPLQSGMQASLRSVSARPPRDVPLGTVRLLDAGLNIGAVDLAGIERKERSKMVFSGNERLPRADFGPIGGRWELRVDGRPILSGKVNRWGMNLAPASGDLLNFRAGAEHFADIDELPPSGTFDLVLEHPSAETLRVPIARWSKTTVAMPRSEQPLPARLAIPHRSLAP